MRLCEFALSSFVHVYQACVRAYVAETIRLTVCDALQAQITVLSLTRHRCVAGCDDGGLQPSGGSEYESRGRECGQC